MSRRNDLKPVDLQDLGERPKAPAISMVNRARGRKVESRNANDAYEILIYDEIGYFGVMAVDVKNMLQEAGGRDVVVRINSPGGDVWEGFAIFNDLIAYTGEVTIEVVGIAASAASFIAMAGDSVTMAENSMMMIHRAMTYAGGDSDFLHTIADMTADADHMIAGIYAMHASAKNNEADHFFALMDKTTWLTPDEAVAEGLADKVGDQVKITARFDLSMYNGVPKGLSITDRQAKAEPSKQDLVRALRDAGVTRSAARDLLESGQGQRPNRAGASSGVLTGALQQLLKTAQEGVQNHA